MHRNRQKQQRGHTDASQLQDKTPSRAKRGDPLHKLHHSIGNQAVTRLFQAGAIQAKLTIGAANDKYEQEADRVADQVMRMPDPQVASVSDGNQPKNNTSPAIQRMCTDCQGEEEERLQRKPVTSHTPPRISALTGPLAARFPLQRQKIGEEVDNDEDYLQAKASTSNIPTVTPGLHTRINTLKGTGQPLSPSTRAFFEPRFGADVGNVRVHNDVRAVSVARSINARAFTLGRDVVFSAGEYSSGSSFPAQQLPHVKFTTSELPAQFHGEVAQPDNRHGMPRPLKAGLEALSGMDLSSVRVHNNSSKPAQLNALAYTQGQDIHVAPSQEKHLPHEGWHAVQQMQGRVTPTMQAKGVPINDDAGLEREATVMGAKALGMEQPGHTTAASTQQGSMVLQLQGKTKSEAEVIQRQPQCPSGSCHVHVEHYQSVFGDKVEEDLRLTSPNLITSRKLTLSPREMEVILEWIRSVRPQQQGSQRLSGQHIKRDVVQEYRKHRGEFESRPNRKVKVITFEVPQNETDPDWSKLKASEVSAKQKKKTFEDLWLLPEIKIFPTSVGRKEFVDYIEDQNRDEGTFGIIVQLPVPAHLQGDVKRIAPEKDLDSLSLKKGRKFHVPAASEGAVRVTLPFVQSGQTVAVIGGKGFVGSGVVSLLKESGITVGVFDEGDDLQQVKSYDVVVSAVGKPRIVKSEHLKPEHILVVDTGFIPETERGGKLKVIGDVDESAQAIPQHITPVPGGIGPVEMAALMERAAKLLGVEVKSWKVELRDGKLRAVFSE